MNDVTFWECPNCGGTDFVEIAPNKHRCAYCGTVSTSHETTPDLVKCPHCGFDNERGDRYCNNCGQVLARGLPVIITKIDPAVLSIIVTIVGSLFLPIGSSILGLVLGYKALKDARAGGGRDGGEKRAKTAIIIGWVVIAFSTLPLCMAMAMPGVQWGWSICDGLSQALGSLLSDILG